MEEHDRAGRLAALAEACRALVEARAPRRTVAATAAAVAQALFGGPGSRRPCGDATVRSSESPLPKPSEAQRRRRRGKKKKEVEETEQEVVVSVEEEKKEAQEEPAAPAALGKKPDEPVPVYKFGPPLRERGLPDDDRDGGARRPCGHCKGSGPCRIEDGLRALEARVARRPLLRRDAVAHDGLLSSWPPSLPRPPTPPRMWSSDG